MGLSSKKTKQTTNQQTSLTTTPTNPQWVTDSISGLSDKINSTFNGLDPKSLIAGPDPLQTLAGSNAGALKTSPLISSAGAAGPQTVQGASSLDNLQAYMNPFLKDVVDTSLADYDTGAGFTRAADQLARAGDSTFGGSSGALQTAFSNDAINRGRGALSAGLRSDAFNTGLSASADDANRRQAASIANAGFGESALQRQLAAGQAQGAEDRANIATQATTGDQLRQIAQAQAQSPINTLLAQIAAQSGLPLNLFNGQTANGTMTGTGTTTTSGLGSLFDMLKLGWSPKAGFSAGLGG